MISVNDNNKKKTLPLFRGSIAFLKAEKKISGSLIFLPRKWTSQTQLKLALFHFLLLLDPMLTNGHSLFDCCYTTGLGEAG